MIISWEVRLPKFGSLWETVVNAYEKQTNRKEVAAAIELTQKQLDKMISGTEGRQLSVRRFESFLDGMDQDGRNMIIDFLDWKYRVPKEKRQEEITLNVHGLLTEVKRLYSLQGEKEK